MAVASAEVASIFVAQYYHVLTQHPNMAHQFYKQHSSMIRVDGDSTQTASDISQIQELLLPLNFVIAEIKTINGLDSLDESVLVMISGTLKIKDISRRRNFVQSVFLAPQENGYFILNDIFHFTDDEETHRDLAPVASKKIDTQPHASTSPAETPDYGLEEKARGYVDSIHIEDDPVDKYSLPEQQQPHKDLETEIVMKETSALEASKVHETPVQPHQDLETETMVKETSAQEEVSPSIPSDAHKIHETPVDLEKESWEEKESWDLETSEQEPSTPSDAHKIHETPIDQKESWEEETASPLIPSDAHKIHKTPVDLEKESWEEKESWDLETSEQEASPSIPSDAHKIHETPVDLEKESRDLETSEQEASPSIPSDAHKIHKTPVGVEKESWEEKPPVKSYASILGSPGGKPSVAQQPSQRSSPIPSDVHHSSQLSSPGGQPSVAQQPSNTSSPIPSEVHHSSQPAADRGLEEARGGRSGRGRGRGRGRTSYRAVGPRGNFDAKRR